MLSDRLPLPHEQAGIHYSRVRLDFLFRALLSNPELQFSLVLAPGHRFKNFPHSRVFDLGKVSGFWGLASVIFFWRVLYIATHWTFLRRRLFLLYRLIAHVASKNGHKLLDLSLALLAAFVAE